ncbi:MAG: aminotransferase class I/II-fold pyridoxal phosphate-dependent enzyme, partial [Actinomycetota bacterium]|nr:aminotransferase class I/II-fold pyridoxal phosphate-dependent enzyme [Actinomycetota bacterium]
MPSCRARPGDRAHAGLPTLPAHRPRPGQGLLEVPIDPDAARAGLDLAGIERAIAAGGRTLLLCHPHNPVGRAWDRVELTALRDVVEPAGVRVVSDEIHAPLVHPGVEFVPYA